MDFPPVTVCIITYNRPKEIRETLRALVAHIIYPKERLLFHIADDGSPDGYLDSIRHEFGLNTSFSVTQRKGWGANANHALDSITTQYIFLCEDDYVAQRDLNIEHGVALMNAEHSVGMVRYDGISGHILDLRLDEAKTELGNMSYLRIYKQSPHLNVYSNRPHLLHRRFLDYYGLYAEGMKLGDTESEYAYRVKDMEHGPEIVALHDGIPSAFAHIGHSWQHSSEDIGND